MPATETSPVIHMRHPEPILKAVEEWTEPNEAAGSNVINQLGRGDSGRSGMAITPLSILAHDILRCLRNDRTTGDSTLYARISAEKVPAVLGAICQILQAERERRLIVEPQDAKVLTSVGEEILARTN